MCRALLIRTLALHGDKEIITEAQNRFEKHLKGDSIHADLRSAVISYLKILFFFHK